MTPEVLYLCSKHILLFPFFILQEIWRPLVHGRWAQVQRRKALLGRDKNLISAAKAFGTRCGLIEEQFRKKKGLQEETFKTPILWKDEVSDYFNYDVMTGVLGQYITFSLKPARVEVWILETVNSVQNIDSVQKGRMPMRTTYIEAETISFVSPNSLPMQKIPKVLLNA